MKEFTGYEYLLIDIANNYGLDKIPFEDRIQWVYASMEVLETLLPEAENRPQYYKAVQTLRKVQAGLPTGHYVTLDASCSGIQIMSAATGCKAGAEATGLINPYEPSDAYSLITNKTNDLLHAQNLSIDVPRALAKKATMITIYGGSEEPKVFFGGEDSPEYLAFMQACHEIAPGAMELLQDLIGSWQPMALKHQWTLPDGFEAVIKVMETKETRIEVDELNHSTFTFVYKENQGKKFGVSNVANVVHSMDAYVLRSLIRRTNYDVSQVSDALLMLEIEILERRMGRKTQDFFGKHKYVQLYRQTKMVDVVILPYLHECINMMDSDHIKKLNGILVQMLKHKPFQTVTVHDAFGASPNNLNVVRYWYKELLAEIAESEILSSILSEIHGEAGQYQKKSNGLGELIRKSNYALM